jgi:hypothetical protein
MRLCSSHLNTQTMHIKSVVHSQQHCFVFVKPFTLAGFEPGSSVPEDDSVSTAPGRHGKITPLNFDVVK